MPVKAVVENARSIGNGVWLGELTPPEVSQLGKPIHTRGARSVVLADDISFDAGRLEFGLQGLAVLNLGTSAEALLVSTQPSPKVEIIPPEASVALQSYSFGPGDREFLRTIRHPKMPQAMADAGERLLAMVRQKFPGDLKRGIRTNFVETPDNFWAIVVQPFRGNYDISVKGAPSTFHPDAISIKANRGSYSRFYLSTPHEVLEAFSLISEAKMH